MHEGGRARLDPVDRAAEGVERDAADAARRARAPSAAPTMPASRVPIPALLSGVVKKSDLANCGARVSLPPLAYQGRWQAW